MLLASSRQRSGMLCNILQGTGKAPQRLIQLKLSTVLRLRNLVLEYKES